MQNSGIAEKSTHLKYKEFTVCDDRDGMLHDFIKYRNQIRISPLEKFYFRLGFFIHISFINFLANYNKINNVYKYHIQILFCLFKQN